MRRRADAFRRLSSSATCRDGARVGRGGGQGARNMYFLCFLSLASSQSSPERNQVSCCTGKETEPPNPARKAFRPRHLQPWVFYCVSWRDSTKQNPRRLLNAGKWLKIEHNNYHGFRVGAAPAPQLPPLEGRCRSAQGGTPAPEGGLGPGVLVNFD